MRGENVVGERGCLCLFHLKHFLKGAVCDFSRFHGLMPDLVMLLKVRSAIFSLIKVVHITFE